MTNTETESKINFQLKRRHWFGVVGLLLLSITAGLFYWARFETYSVCYHCAMKRDAVIWEIPFVHSKIFEDAEIMSSPLSDVILEHELTGEHEHDWKFVFGTGNGSPMVFGTSRSVASAMTSSKSGEFLDLVMTHSGRTEARKWLAGFRDTDRAEWCRCIAEAIEGKTFSHSEEFKNWLAETMVANQDFWH